MVVTAIGCGGEVSVVVHWTLYGILQHPIYLHSPSLPPPPSLSLPSTHPPSPSLPFSLPSPSNLRLSGETGLLHLQFLHFKPSIDASSSRPDVISSMKIISSYAASTWTRTRTRQQVTSPWYNSKDQCTKKLLRSSYTGLHPQM